MNVSDRVALTRNFLIHAINALLDAGLITLDNVTGREAEEAEAGSAMLPIHGKNCVISWRNIGFGELGVTVWGDIDYLYIRDQEEKRYAKYYKKASTFYLRENEINEIMINYYGCANPNTLDDFELLFNGLARHHPKEKKHLAFSLLYSKSFAVCASGVLSRRNKKVLLGNKYYKSAFEREYISSKDQNYIKSLPMAVPVKYAPWGSGD